MKCKYFFLFTLLFFGLSASVYAGLLGLMDSGVMRDIPTYKGLNISQSLVGTYNPLRVMAETRVYYRIPMFTNRQSKIWQGAKVDFGIENIFSLSGDMIGGFIDFRPLSFVGFRVSGYYHLMYEAMGFGYAGFDTADADYSPYALNEMERANANGYFLSLSVPLSFKSAAVAILNYFSLNYAVLGDKEYYYDVRTALLHKKSELELLNSLYLLGNISPFYIGAYYGFSYLVNSKIFEHKLGVAATMNLSFLSDKLVLDIGLMSGVHLSLPHYINAVFVEAKVILNYRVF